jgi:hypothetical protein
MTRIGTRPKLSLAKVQRKPNAQRIKQAVRLFRNDLAPRSIRRHNARQWLTAIERLGDKWLLATKPLPQVKEA